MYGMKQVLLKNSLLIFLGGICYGAVGSVIKMGYASGYTPTDLVCIQMLSALVIFAFLALIHRIRRRESYELNARQLISLVLAGIATCLTSLFYAYSLERLPASVSITLLFQFTWLGVALEACMQRKSPGLWRILATGIILFGTFAASGLLGFAIFEPDRLFHELDPLGVLFGLLAAVSSTCYLYSTGNAAVELHVSQRAFFIALGASLTVLCIDPSSIYAYAKEEHALLFAGFLGFFAIVLPVYLFATGAPALPSGLVTIMASSELPASVSCAVLLLGEDLNPLRFVGVVLILLGVVLAQIPFLKLSNS